MAETSAEETAKIVNFVKDINCPVKGLVSCRFEASELEDHFHIPFEPLFCLAAYPFV
jgi:hypothetical protein